MLSFSDSITTEGPYEIFSVPILCVCRIRPESSQRRDKQQRSILFGGMNQYKRGCEGFLPKCIGHFENLPFPKCDWGSSILSALILENGRCSGCIYWKQLSQ